MGQEGHLIIRLIKMDTLSSGLRQNHRKAAHNEEEELGLYTHCSSYRFGCLVRFPLEQVHVDVVPPPHASHMCHKHHFKFPNIHCHNICVA